MRIVAFIVVIISALSMDLKAQQAEDATASVTIISTDGAVVGDTSNSDILDVAFNKKIPKRTSGYSRITAGSKVIDNTKTVALASFNITASNCYYNISLPVEALIIERNSGNEMVTINGFSISAVQNNLSETQTIRAIINAGSSPTPGTYVTSLPLSVIVNFN